MWKWIKGHLSAITAVTEHEYLFTKQRRDQKYLCQAGQCRLCKAKYCYVLSCLSVAKDSFNNTPREKYCLLCSRPNVQPGENALGTLVQMPLGRTFCHLLTNSSSSLASCKEPTRAKGSLDK